MPRGFNTKTPENVARAHALRDVGMSFAEIAEEMGVGRSTIYTWFADPDGSVSRARRERYSKPCTSCGATTDGSRGYVEEDAYCRSCAPDAYAVWTEDAIVFAIQEWADRNGGIPPAANDFWRDRARGDERVPSVNHVLLRCGSWSAAIRAAGFEPHAAGPVGGYTALTPAQRQECARRYAAGESLPQIAARFDCSLGTVRKWVARHGVTVRDPREGRRMTSAKDAA